LLSAGGSHSDEEKRLGFQVSGSQVLGVHVLGSKRSLAGGVSPPFHTAFGIQYGPDCGRRNQLGGVD
jgi:hypothetical protein